MVHVLVLVGMYLVGYHIGSYRQLLAPLACEGFLVLAHPVQ
jgi:hypothetical protein